MAAHRRRWSARDTRRNGIGGMFYSENDPGKSHSIINATKLQSPVSELEREDCPHAAGSKHSPQQPNVAFKNDQRHHF